MAKTLTCSGAITVDASDRPQCPDGWLVDDAQSGYMSVSDFNDLAPEILLLFVLALGIKFVLGIMNWSPNRN